MVLTVLQTPTDRRAPIALETDILVVGGGAAGVAAAVTAARQGLRVVLLKRYGFCGGGAVAGLSGTICGMYEASDDPNARPHQIVHGFLEEFVQHLSDRGGLTPPVRYGKTFTRVHDPLVWRETADLLLRDAGVQVLLHTVVTEALVEGSERIDGIVAYTKQGPLSVRAKVTVDASGDADVVAMAGLPTFIGHDGRVQNPTMIFRLGGVDVEKFVSTYGPRPSPNAGSMSSASARSRAHSSSACR
jgi:flavin-dependent dehydrogenase